MIKLSFVIFNLCIHTIASAALLDTGPAVSSCTHTLGNQQNDRSDSFVIKQNSNTLSINFSHSNLDSTMELSKIKIPESFRKQKEIIQRLQFQGFRISFTQFDTINKSISFEMTDGTLTVNEALNFSTPDLIEYWDFIYKRSTLAPIVSIKLK